MKSDNELLSSVEMSLHKNMGKGIIGLLVIILCTSLSIPAVMIITILFAGTIILPFAILLFFVALIVMLALGYLTLLSKFYRRQPAVLGHIFSPFYQFKNNFFLALIIASVLVFLSSILSIIGISFVPFNIDFSNPESITLYLFNVGKILPLLSGILILIFFIAFILPNGFIWFIKQDFPEKSIKETFKTSWELTKGRRFHLMNFLLKSGGWWLLVSVITFCVTVVLNFQLSPTSFSTNANYGKISLIMNLCNITYIITFYCSIIRIFTGLVAFYDEVTGFKMQENSDIKEIKEPVLQLSEATTDNQVLDENITSEQNNE